MHTFVPFTNNGIMENIEEIWKEVEEMYSQSISIKDIGRKFKLGEYNIKKHLIDVKMFDRCLGKIPWGKSSVNLGEKFGRWTVINPLVRTDFRYMAEVLCECGTKELIRPSNLRNGRTKGCKHCMNKGNYPTFRKSSANPDPNLNGLSPHWISAINQNKERGIHRTIGVSINSFDLLHQLEKQDFKCAYTGENLNVLNVLKSKSNASVDRIDSLLDYTKDNIQWVTKDVNRMKNIFSDKNFLDTCFKIYKFRHGNPEPSSSNINLVDEKVQRLIGEDDYQ
jgi:hypothetical protein